MIRNAAHYRTSSKRLFDLLPASIDPVATLREDVFGRNA
jgi:hypothetical protein